MLSPIDMVIPGQEIYETEYQLDVTQMNQFAAFLSKCEWTWELKQLKSEPFRFWQLTSGDVVIHEFVLSAALRKAREIEKGR